MPTLTIEQRLIQESRRDGGLARTEPPSQHGWRGRDRVRLMDPGRFGQDLSGWILRTTTLDLFRKAHLLQPKQLPLRKNVNETYFIS
jgi:hypothetical protein